MWVVGWWFSGGLWAGGLVVIALDLQEEAVVSNPAWIGKTFTPFVRLAHTRRALGWTGRRLVRDSDNNCAWLTHESKAVQMHAQPIRGCLHVPRCLVALKIFTESKTTI